MSKLVVLNNSNACHCLGRTRKKKRIDIFNLINSYKPFRDIVNCVFLKIFTFTCSVLFLMVILSTNKYISMNYNSIQNQKFPQSNFREIHHQSRLLLQVNATTTIPPVHINVINTCELEKNNYYGLWICIYIVIIMTTFIAIAIICDDFFVPSLDAISEKMNLSEDVAGATFMAAGSSAPELFTSIVGVTYETDVGVGTIVGSALFNIFVIIAFTGLLSRELLCLDWKPLARDAFFYSLSIIFYIIFSLDGYFYHYESVCLLLLYVIYIIMMVFNPRLMTCLGKITSKTKKSVTPGNEKDENFQLKNKDEKSDSTQKGIIKRFSMGPGGHARRLSIISQKSDGYEKKNSQSKLNSVKSSKTITALQSGVRIEPLGEESEEISVIENGEDYDVKFSKDNDINENNQEKNIEVDQEVEGSHSEEEGLQLYCCNCCPRVRTEIPLSTKVRNEGGVLNWLKFILRWFIFIEAFPFVVLYSWTIPDCENEKYKKYFLVSFIVSVFWIAVISFAMVTAVTRLGCILSIDEYTMGLVFIAVGTSVPDAMSSILVAREGFGDMAVSNAIGSNVFDINLGLGLPFLIKILTDLGAPIDMLTSQERARNVAFASTGGLSRLRKRNITNPPPCKIWTNTFAATFSYIGNLHNQPICTFKNIIIHIPGNLCSIPHIRIHSRNILQTHTWHILLTKSYR
ncbi:Na(+)/K(+)/Ca(2+)-exchange protein 4 [Intoshia linei]|uniref:Na(+)/K(+)/Ca(2+)-exchange protein 4 n=1 Tax=Intoshia linei TaxID=1819745 RepID=A0A177BC51_9BILA|nr:Na(+)/K(+)/Ca(2+)-exchange protein 4 [Intoshia linei]